MSGRPGRLPDALGARIEENIARLKKTLRWYRTAMRFHTLLGLGQRAEWPAVAQNCPRTRRE